MKNVSYLAWTKLADHSYFVDSGTSFYFIDGGKNDSLLENAVLLQSNPIKNIEFRMWHKTRSCTLPVTKNLYYNNKNDKGCELIKF